MALTGNYKSNSPYPYNLLDDLFGYVEPKIDDTYYDMNFIVDNIDDNMKALFERNSSFFDQRKRDILMRHYKSGMPLSVIALEYGISRERARQVLNECIRVIRNPQNMGFILFGFNEIEPKVITPERKMADGKRTAEELGIGEIGLSDRAYNSLDRAGFETVGDIMGKNVMELKKIKGIGDKCAREIRRKVRTVLK